MNTFTLLVFHIILLYQYPIFLSSEHDIQAVYIMILIVLLWKQACIRPLKISLFAQKELFEIAIL